MKRVKYVAKANMWAVIQEFEDPKTKKKKQKIDWFHTEEEATNFAKL